MAVVLALVGVSSGAGFSLPAAGAVAPSRFEAPGAVPLDVAVLTPDRDDRYEVGGDTSRLVVVAAASNVDINLRVALLAQGAPVTADQQSCLTWLGPLDSKIQPGVVLRHRVDGGRTRAVMVSQNVYYAARQHVNVHVVDSAAAPTLDHVASVDIGRSIGTVPYLRSLPWRFCARIRGHRVDVKAWPTSDPEPSWGDPDAGGSVTVPPTAPATGRPGGYLGHLAPGEVTVAADLVVRGSDGDASIHRVGGVARRLGHRLFSAC